MAKGIQTKLSGRELAPSDGKPTIRGGRAKQSTWELNHAVIRDAYVSLLSKLGRRPTTTEVSDLAQLSYDATRRHIKELKFEPIAHPLRVMTDDVLISIIESAKAGNAASQKLYFQIMEGWRESNIVEAQVDHTVSDTKFSIKVHKAGTPKE